MARLSGPRSAPRASRPLRDEGGGMKKSPEFGAGGARRGGDGRCGCSCGTGWITTFGGAGLGGGAGRGVGCGVGAGGCWTVGSGAGGGGGCGGAGAGGASGGSGAGGGGAGLGGTGARCGEVGGGGGVGAVSVTAGAVGGGAELGSLGVSSKVISGGEAALLSANSAGFGVGSSQNTSSASRWISSEPSRNGTSHRRSRLRFGRSELTDIGKAVGGRGSGGGRRSRMPVM